MLPMVPVTVKTLLANPGEKEKLIPLRSRCHQLARQSSPDRQIFHEIHGVNQAFRSTTERVQTVIRCKPQALEGFLTGGVTCLVPHSTWKAERHCLSIFRIVSVPFPSLPKIRIRPNSRAAMPAD